MWIDEQTIQSPPLASTSTPVYVQHTHAHTCAHPHTQLHTQKKKLCVQEKISICDKKKSVSNNVS